MKSACEELMLLTVITALAGWTFYAMLRPGSVFVLVRMGSFC